MLLVEKENNKVPSKPITNDRIYELVNSVRLELKGDIRDLRDQFDILEAGRLTRLEGKMNEFEVSQVKKDATLSQNQAVLSTKFVIIGFIAVTLITGLASAFWAKVLK